jgi:hypothetical protein
MNKEHRQLDPEDVIQQGDEIYFEDAPTVKLTWIPIADLYHGRRVSELELETPIRREIP